LLRYIRQVSFEVKVFQTADVADSSYCPAISLKKPLLPNLIAAQKSTGFSCVSLNDGHFKEPTELWER